MKRKKTYKYDPDYRVPLGAFIRETTAYKKIGVRGFTASMGLSIADFNDLCNGKRRLTPVEAITLTQIAGGRPKLWLSLDQRFHRPVEAGKRT